MLVWWSRKKRQIKKPRNPSWLVGGLNLNPPNFKNKAFWLKLPNLAPAKIFPPYIS